MQILKDENFLFALLFVLNLICLFFAISNLSISYYEAEIFFNNEDLAGVLANLSCQIFGQNDLAVRLPFLLLHFINCILMYRYSKLLLKRKGDRLLCVAIYMFLPGVMVSALLVNVAGVILFFTLLFLYLYEKGYYSLAAFLLSFTLLIDISFGVLYLGVFFYAIYIKNQKLSILSFGLFLIALVFYTYDIHGKPKGYFLDAVGIYAAVFSPLIFLFFVYVIYRIWVKERKTLLWFVVITAFCISLLLSFRQRFEIEKFLPYVVISIPILVRVFFNSQRVRLPEFRKKHNVLAVVLLIGLFFHSFLLINNQIFYPTIFKNNPQDHFIYEFDIAKDLSNELKSLGITNIITLDDELRIRLKFYGINSGGRDILSQEPIGAIKNVIEIKKYKNVIVKFYIF
ncbi:MAG: hypothetical protein GXZ15_03060 [Campylobacter sp.]|nr:hypothetical protein [Campylobacter sp.]